VRQYDELLLLTTMLFADELRGPNEFDTIPAGATGEPTRGEVTQAVKLIDAMTQEFDPADYENRHRARLEALIESKRKGGAATLSAAEDEAAPAEPVPDLMAALKASLERVRRD
jgi:DNA end-binding protein Ku